MTAPSPTPGDRAVIRRVSDIAAAEVTIRRQGRHWTARAVRAGADSLDAFPRRAVPWEPMGITYHWALDTAALVLETAVHPILKAVARAVGEAALEVLPVEWHVLPDGRATHSVLRTAVLRRLYDNGYNQPEENR